MKKRIYNKRNKFLRIGIVSCTLLLMVGCVFCTDIFTVGETVTKDLYTQIKDFYCDGLFYLLGAVDLLFMAIYAKDDKKFPIFKNAGIVVVLVFIGLHMIGAIRTTAANIAAKFDTTSDTTIEYTGDTTDTSGE